MPGCLSCDQAKSVSRDGAGCPGGDQKVDAFQKAEMEKKRGRGKRLFNKQSKRSVNDYITVINEMSFNFISPFGCNPENRFQDRYVRLQGRTWHEPHL